MKTDPKRLLSYTLFFVVLLGAAMGGQAYLDNRILADQGRQRAEAGVLAVRRQVEAAARAGQNAMLSAAVEDQLAFFRTLDARYRSGALGLEEVKRLAAESLSQRAGSGPIQLFAISAKGVVQAHSDPTRINTMLDPGLLARLERLAPGQTGEFEPDSAPPTASATLAVYQGHFPSWGWTLVAACATGARYRLLGEAELRGALGKPAISGLTSFLLDSRGTFSRPDSSDSLALPASLPPPLIKTLRDRQNGWISWPLEWTPQAGLELTTFGFQTIDGTDLIVGVFAAQATFDQPLILLRNRALLLFAAALLLAVPLIRSLVRSQRAPLEDLSGQLRRINPEIGELPEVVAAWPETEETANHLNRLLAAIRDREAQLAAEQSDNQKTQYLLREEIAGRKGTEQKLLAEITTRKSAENYLQLFKSVFDNAIEGIYITDAETRILTINPSFSRITGYEPGEVIGQAASLFGSGPQGQEFYRRMWETIRRDGCWSGEVWNRKKNGIICPQWLSISAIENELHETTHFFAFFHDITELKKREKQISIMAYSDALTKLPNRAALEVRLAKAIAHATRERQALAVFFIDLDNFKNINDSLGHDKGDQVLIEVADRLSQTIRAEDTLSRLGGDEFILLSENVSNENDVGNLASRLLASLKQPILLAPHTIYIHASIGIALFPEDGRTSQELIKNADMAMYKAKSEGKNTFVMFTEEMNEKLLNRIRIENSIRTGLKRREFSVFYQPKIDLVRDQPTSFEALIRWRRNGTIIGPDDFIAIAEESGLIDEMSLYVLDEVCLFLSRMQKQGRRVVPISVNMSPRTFHNPQIVETIDALLAVHAIDHHLIEFEITETTAMKDVQHTLATMHRFRQRGIRFSIDDFGTGYSSLSYLKEMPVSTLKIDKRFIHAQDANSRSIVSTITAMSKQMQLTVVAEGVETDSQLQWLKSIGCNEVQGFFYARPMPEQDALDYLGNGTSHHASALPSPPSP